MNIMDKLVQKKLDNIINDLSSFIENDYSSKFKFLTAKEDRQLFFLAGILAKLKQVKRDTVSSELKDSYENNVILFPSLKK